MSRFVTSFCSPAMPHTLCYQYLLLDQTPYRILQKRTCSCTLCTVSLSKGVPSLQTISGCAPFHPNLSRTAWTFLLSSKNLTLEQAMRAQRGSGGIALLFLEPRRYKRAHVQHHFTAAWAPGTVWTGPRDGLDRPQGRAPGTVWTGVENPPSSTGIPFLDRPAHIESLYRLSYPGPRSLT
jgi:hypothetical protein